MRKVFFIIFCFYIFNCCKNRTVYEFEKEDFIVIPIEENISEISNFDSFIEKVKYIPLETNEDSKIQDITQVELIDEKIIIFDKKGKSVLIFNSEGSFLHKISKLGTGFNEYLDIRNIATDEENKKIYLFDQLQFTIFEYDLDGNFIKKISINNIFFSYFKSSNGRFYCYMHNRPYKENYYDLISFDQNEIKNMYFPFSKKDNNFWFLPLYPFYCFNKQLNYVDIFRGQTFILSERPIPKYLIDFGIKQMPLKIRNNKVLFFENKNKYAYLTNEFLENDNYLQFSYYWGEDIIN